MIAEHVGHGTIEIGHFALKQIMPKFGCSQPLRKRFDHRGRHLLTMLTISSVEAFSDNYIWVLHNQTDAIAVDPGDAAPLMEFLDAKKLTLQAILVTHRHRDHIGGIEVLAHRYPGVRIIGPTTLALATESVKDGDQITLLAQRFEVIAVPGHTLDHLAYYAAPCAASGALPVPQRNQGPGYPQRVDKARYAVATSALLVRPHWAIRL